jgi:hypothetical protein
MVTAQVVMLNALQEGDHAMRFSAETGDVSWPAWMIFSLRVDCLEEQKILNTSRFIVPLRAHLRPARDMTSHPV